MFLATSFEPRGKTMILNKTKNSPDMEREAKRFYFQMNQRRSVRSFDGNPISIEVILDCIRAAGTAPSGANRQPWQFVVVVDKEIRKEIRRQAESEEKDFYFNRASQEMLTALKPIERTWSKPHLEVASALVVVFSKTLELSANESLTTYYAKESVGIATVILITAFHRLGVSTLTHTPSPMFFLNQLLNRPKEEKPFLILAIGWPSVDYQPPNLTRKDISQICTII